MQVKSIAECSIAGQKYCRMLTIEHSAILLTFIKLPIVIKIFVLPMFLSGRFTQALLYVKTARAFISSMHTVCVKMKTDQ